MGTIWGDFLQTHLVTLTGTEVASFLIEKKQKMLNVLRLSA
jgi:hypothetical protein